jgi:16S rRNA (cytosine967-C5)-methyltransferase
MSSRTIALEAVRRVVDEGAYSSLVIPGLLGRSELEPRDRAFATDMAYGVIRHLLILDRAIESVASRPLDRMDPLVRHVLRLGAEQLFFVGVPRHAAVGETVELARANQKGFVNAVLRRLADAGLPPDQPGTTDTAISARTGMAPWLVSELRRVVGNDRVGEAAAALAAPAPRSLRATACADPSAGTALMEAITAAGLEAHPSAVDDAVVLVDRGDPSAFPGASDGAFVVQDAASVFVVRTLAPVSGDRVLDVCAAPGGKALFAACLVGRDGRVVAADANPARVGLIRTQAQRLGASVELVVQDGTRPALGGSFDRVLVDAPCSGVGSARRRPELLWRPRKDRLSQLARLQVAIASASADLVAPGGRLVYSVCTFPRAETDAAADAIARRRPDLVPVRTAGPSASEPALRHRLWPHEHGCDGMFVAAFERRP